MVKSRDIWVDIVKVFACILVVLGHFFPSMVASDLLPSSALYEWFQQTIYYFHVPLFFICSGFLHQKYSNIRSVSSLGFNVIKKVLAYGIPYFSFSVVSYLLKTVFSSTVNTEVGGFFDTLFVHPMSPYWYLYALITMFFFAFTVTTNKEAFFVVLVAFLLKITTFFIQIDIPILRYFLENSIWFAIGIGLSFFNVVDFMKKRKVLLQVCMPVVCTIVFFLLSVFVQSWSSAFAFVMGILGCAGTILFALLIEEKFNPSVVKVLSIYSFPVFLMHTIFAAGLRSVLFKLSIHDSIFHVVFGLVISFIGPVIAAYIMSKIKWFDFILYPNRYLKINRKK